MNNGSKASPSLRLMQSIARVAPLRGLPRLAWMARHQLVGTGTSTVWFENRFRMACDSNSYPMVMALCGFVYPRVESALRRIVQPQSVFIDAGANVGFVSLLASTLYGPGSKVSVHAFEPDPTVVEWLQRNVKLNPVDVTVNQMGLGAANVVSPLTVSARSGWSTLATEPPGGFSFLPKAGTAMVQVGTLDAYCQERKIRPSVVKIDVEGYELQVIEGALEVLRDAKPSLIVEVNPTRLAAAGASAEILVDRLQGLGYALFHVDPRRASETRRRKTWNGLPEISATDVTVDRDFDIVAVRVS